MLQTPGGLQLTDGEIRLTLWIRRGLHCGCSTYRGREVYLGGSATGASHSHGLGAAIIAGLDVELDLLTLAQAAVAVGLDAGLQTRNYQNQSTERCLSKTSRC